MAILQMQANFAVCHEAREQKKILELLQRRGTVELAGRPRG